MRKMLFYLYLCLLYITAFSITLGCSHDMKDGDQRLTEDKEDKSNEHKEDKSNEHKEDKSNKHNNLDSLSRIETIVSHNPAPSFEGNRSSGRPIFDDKFDWSEYQRVNYAINNLAYHAEDEWRELLKHFDDNRYSTTMHGEYGHNYVVSDICELIVSSCLSQGYMKHYGNGIHTESAYRVIKYPRGLYNKSQIRDWCEKRKDKKLYELQVEMCEWAISIIMRMNDLSEEEKIPFVDAVQKEIDTLRNSKKAVIFTGFCNNEVFAPYRR
jgi:hypothetical protein